MYQFYISRHFKKQLKPLLKKHKDLKKEVVQALKDFRKDETHSLGANTYKIRISSPSLNKGKSHGFRLIILLVTSSNLIAPITIYFKGDRNSITKKEITAHAKIISKELKNFTKTKKSYKKY